MTRMRVAMAAVLLLVSTFFLVRPFGQQQGDAAAIAAIKAEGMRRSEAPRLFHVLTDVIGARLPGSPAHLAAARWVVDELKQWGLASTRLEPFEFGRGWTLEKLTAEM